MNIPVNSLNHGVSESLYNKSDLLADWQVLLLPADRHIIRGRVQKCSGSPSSGEGFAIIFWVQGRSLGFRQSVSDPLVGYCRVSYV